MRSADLILRSLVLFILCGACVRRGTHIITGTQTPEQSKVISRTSDSIARAYPRDNNYDRWRCAVLENTRRLVGEGRSNLQEVKVLVCQRTIVEEAQARKVKHAWAETTHILTAEAVRKYVDVPSDRRAEFDAQIKSLVHDILDRSFTECRDSMIEELFDEAMKEASPQ